MSIDTKLWTQAEHLASRNYDVEQSTDTLTNGEAVVLLKNPELPGCRAHGATINEATANLKEARTEYIYSLLEDALPVPYPRVIASRTGVDVDATRVFKEVVVGFGVKMSGIFEPSTREKDITFSYRGDFVKQT